MAGCIFKQLPVCRMDMITTSTRISAAACRPKLRNLASSWKALSMSCLSPPGSRFSSCRTYTLPSTVRETFGRPVLWLMRKEGDRLTSKRKCDSHNYVGPSVSRGMAHASSFVHVSNQYSPLLSVSNNLNPEILRRLNGLRHIHSDNPKGNPNGETPHIDGSNKPHSDDCRAGSLSSWKIFDRSWWRSRIHHILFSGSCLVFLGCVLSYCIDNNMSFAEFLKLVNQIIEEINLKGEDLIHRFTFPRLKSRRAPLKAKDDVLLPDFDDLKYPAGLPTLVLDFDKVIAMMEHDRHSGWRIVKRPGGSRFFRELMPLYEIVIWSDDSYPVAQEACAKWGLPIVGVLHRDQCKKENGHWVKDIGRLGRRLDRTIMIDHDVHAFGNYPENGIVVRPFKGDVLDCELDKLVEFLKAVAMSPDDVRDTIMNHGGGDVNLGDRFAHKLDLIINKSTARRSVGKFLGLDKTVGNAFLPPLTGTASEVQSSSLQSPVSNTFRPPELMKVM